MLRGNLIFASALFIISILFLIFTFAYPYKAKIFPLIALIPAMILLMIEIVKELLAAKEKEEVKKEETEGLGSKRWDIWGWMIGTLLMFWLLGYNGTVLFLPFLYLRLQRESWLLSITIPIGCLVFFYGLFNLCLKMPLYPGLLFSIFFT